MAHDAKKKTTDVRHWQYVIARERSDEAIQTEP
jgi:hypothetical protein